VTEQRAFSVKEAADIIGVHPDTIRRAIRAGKLKAAKLNKDYRIAKTDLSKYFRESGGGELFEDDNADP
jgi:excisionase family DNA binding protein